MDINTIRFQVIYLLLTENNLERTGNIYIYHKLHVCIPITNQEINLGFKGDELKKTSISYWCLLAMVTAMKGLDSNSCILNS